MWLLDTCCGHQDRKGLSTPCPHAWMSCSLLSSWFPRILGPAVETADCNSLWRFPVYDLTRWWPNLPRDSCCFWDHIWRKSLWIFSFLNGGEIIYSSAWKHALTCHPQPQHPGSHIEETGTDIHECQWHASGCLGCVCMCVCAIMNTFPQWQILPIWSYLWEGNGRWPVVFWLIYGSSNP